MFNKVTIPLCAAALAAVMAPATSDALEFRLNGSVVDRPTAGFLAVTVDRDGAEPVSAGAFDMDEIDGTGNVLREFIAWCFDLDNDISLNTNYTYSENPSMLDSVPPYLAGAKDRIQKLFDKSYNPDTVLANAQASAGFQIAIWEVLYDDDFNLGTGSFKATNSTALDEAAGYLTDVAAYDGPRNWAIATYDSADAQDLGVASAIPLPAAAWLLLGVSGALVGAKRRSARKAA